MRKLGRRRADVIIIGGGHAGTEAALAASRLGARALLLTHSAAAAGQMSCNPAIGGVGKGHLVKEIDALGGAMALAADDAGIQFRRLNSSRGAAVRATRAQTDRALYKQSIQQHLAAADNLQIIEAAVDDILIRGDEVVGAAAGGEQFFAPTVVLTAGTFLGGVMHIGGEQTPGGRAGSPPSAALAQKLRDLNLPVGRLKTGTPPRLDGDSINFSALEEQPGDNPRPVFSFVGDAARHPPQRPCHITRTTAKAHDIIRAALPQSPLLSGAIDGVGPRYCPSIEDKIIKFAERDSHRVFLEPEGLQTSLYYPNGISTSLPLEAQRRFVAAMPGLENARIVRPGYAVEYDYFDPRALHSSLQTRAVRGLFFAGQINGTTGYEEAAAQGLIAGLNAARMAKELPPWSPRRRDSYIGVMLDDLTGRGVTEPYRMFTSRSECRLSLREDNADLRLTPEGRELGLVNDERWRVFCERRRRLQNEEEALCQLRIRSESGAGETAAKWLCRPENRYEQLAALDGINSGERLQAPADIAEVEARFKYAGYIAHQRAELERAEAEEGEPIPEDFNFAALSGLSTEARELLTRHRPATLRQARRLGGVTPAAVSLLSAHLQLRRRRAA